MAVKMSRRLPLEGVKVLELAGLAPVPFLGMILNDFGAMVCRVNRVGERTTVDTLARGKRSISLNLKSDTGISIFKKLAQQNDVLIEPFRPGVMESLGIGPSNLCKENERLVYVRLNGFSSNGNLSARAGHDINYLAISGILSMLGRKGENPTPPINLLGDFAGGSMVAAFGVMLALFERNLSGKGQVVDASITEGTAYLSTFLQKSRDIGIWFGEKGTNVLDTGAPFYDTYKTKDGKYMAVGAIEDQFYQKFIEGLQMEDELQNQFDIPSWPSMKDQIASKFLTKTRDEWTRIFQNVDACVTPVLELDEAPNYEHNLANETYMKNDKGSYEPSPQPKLSRTPGVSSWRRDPLIGEHTVEVLRETGFTESEIEEFIREKFVEQYFPKASL